VPRMTFPALLLLASGGHNMLVSEGGEGRGGALEGARGGQGNETPGGGGHCVKWVCAGVELSVSTVVSLIAAGRCSFWQAATRIRYTQGTMDHHAPSGKVTVTSSLHQFDGSRPSSPSFAQRAC